MVAASESPKKAGGGGGSAGLQVETDAAGEVQGLGGPLQGLIQLTSHAIDGHGNLQKKLPSLTLRVLKAKKPRTQVGHEAFLFCVQQSLGPDPYVRVVKKKYRQ
jgi:hypothetical protein